MFLLAACVAAVSSNYSVPVPVDHRTDIYSKLTDQDIADLRAYVSKPVLSKVLDHSIAKLKLIPLSNITRLAKTSCIQWYYVAGIFTTIQSQQ